MLSERESGGFYDRFRHRILFPIRDARARMAGFGARIVDPVDVPKFLNTPQTPLFDKGRLLYGLDKARKSIRSLDQAVIVEGYLDVMALHQSGFANAVSPMGTALTEDQLRLLKRFTRRMVLALDPDRAGDQATLRGLTLAREALDREPDPVFDARGLVRHEGRLDADIRVVTLPEGKDPDEVVGEDPSTWTSIVEGAQPVVTYVVDVLARGKDLDNPKVKAEIARQVMPLIEDVANPVEREAHRQGLARRLKVDERALIAWRPAAPRRAGRRDAAPAGEGPPAAIGGPPEAGVQQRFSLGVLLRNPEILYRVDREFQRLELDRLSPQDFTGTERQVIFLAVRAGLAQDDVEPADHWRASLGSPLREAAEGLVQEAVRVDLQDPRAIDEVVAGFLRLRKGALAATRGQLQFQIQAAQEAGDAQVVDLQHEVMRLTRDWDRLDRALARRRVAP
jgi:DNA primase